MAWIADRAWLHSSGSSPFALNSLLTARTLSPAPVPFATTYYSQTSGDPTTLTNWNSVRGGGGTNPANFTTAGNAFVIQNGHNMTAASAWTVSGSGTLLEIENGGTLTANAAVTIGSTATFQIDSGGSYVHNNTTAYGSSILQGTESFASTSNFTINSTSTTGPSGTTFGNLTINLTSDPGAAVSLGGGITTINGNLSIVSTSTREFRLAANSPTSLTTTIGGDLLISGGTLNLVSGTTTLTLNVGGNFNQSSGTLTSTGAGTDTIIFTGSGKTFTQSAGTLTNTNINWTVNSGASLTLANNLPVATSRTLTVNGTLNCATNAVTGAGAFTLASGATLGIGSTAGISSTASTGNIQVTGTRTYDAGATYVYNGSANQAVGNQLPASVANLKIANTGSGGNNTVTGNSGQTVTGTLEVQSGIYSSHSTYNDVTIDFGATLSLAGDVTVSGTWTNNNGSQGSGLTANGFKVTFNGSTDKSITGTTSTTFAALEIAKTSGAKVSLDGTNGATTPVASSLTVTSGVFDQGTTTASCDFRTTGGSIVATVASGATWQNLGTGDVKLSGDVSNNGTIVFNANGTVCGDTDDIQIRSVDGSGTLVTTQRTWSGTGTFSMTDVNVRDQKASGSILSPPAVILVNSGFDAGNNSNWTFLNQCTSGTYTWIGGTAGAATDWTVPTNWNPTRVTPSTSDILIFDGTVTPSPTVTNVPTQTIAVLRLTNSVNGVTLNASGTNTLTLSGGTANGDLEIQAGSLLTVDGANALRINIASGSTGNVNGQIVLQGGAHEVTANGVANLKFSSGSIFTTGTGFTGHPFGIGSGGNGTNQSVQFLDGSSAFFNAGGDPFVLSAPQSVVILNFGSTVTYNSSTAFNSSGYDGRSYGNLIFDGSQSYTGGSVSNGLIVGGSLTIQSGSSFTLSSTLGADLTVVKDFTDNGSFTASSRTVSFQGNSLTGGSTQTITSTNNPENFDGLQILKTDGSVKLGSNVKINGQLQFGGNASNVDVLDLNAKTLTLNGTVGAIPAATSGLKGGASATLNITGTGALGTLNFLSGSRTLSALTMDRTSSGSAVFGNDMTVGSVTLTNGVVNMGAFTLSISGAVTRTSGWIIGNEQRSFNCSSGPGCAVTFDVGTDNGYSPVQESLDVSMAGGYSQTVKAVQGQHPNIHGVSVNALQRYWTLSQPTGAGSVSSGDVTFNYLAGDVVGTESNYKIFRYDGSFTQFNPDTLNTTSHFAKKNGVIQFSDWTLAEAGAVTPGTISFVSAPYTDNETNANHDVTITVRRSGGSDGAVSVNYAVTDGTATIADNDYSVSPASGTFTWNDNDTTDKTITINIKGDQKYESDETINLTLSSVTGSATIGSPNPTTLTITNDDTCAPPPLNLRAWWKGENDANDSAGPNNGQMLGGATFAAGKVGQAMSFNGSFAYMAAPDNPSLRPSGQFSIDLWANFNSVPRTGNANDNMLLAEKDQSYQLYWRADSEKLEFDIADACDGLFHLGFTAPLPTLAAGAWHHYAVTAVDGGSGGTTFHFYFDGVEQTITAISSAGHSGCGWYPFGGNEFHLGFRASNFPFWAYNGLLDEIEIFNRALTSSEVSSIVNADVAGKCAASTVTVAVSPASVAEDQSSNLVYKFTRDGDISQPLTVSFTVGGAAQFSTDYAQSGAATFTATNGTVSFAAGNSTATVTVDPTPDATVEPDEDVVLTITSGAGYYVGTASSATGTILNDDSQPDLVLNKTDSVDPATEGNILIYTLAIQNNGGNATNVVITDTLPANVTFVTASSGCTNSTGTVTCNVGSVPFHTSASRTISVIPTHAAALAGSISNTATATETETDVTPSDNTDNETTAVVSPTCTAPPSGLTNWWMADSSAKDFIGGQHGTLTNGATLAPGRVGNAFSFNGVNQYVSITNSDVLPGNFSMDAWIYPTSTANDAWVFSKELANPINTAVGFYVEAGGKVIAGTRGSSGGTQYRTNDVAIVPNQWQHIVVTYNGGAGQGTGQSFKIYVNGVNYPAVPAGPFSDQSGGTLGTPYSNGNAKIGSYYTGLGGFFPGLIDEVEIFNRILTPTEALNLFNAGTAGKCVTNLSVVKSDSADPSALGNDLTYTITVSYRGASPATNVVATDTLPANVSFVTASSGCSNSSGTVTCNFGTLNNAENSAKTITVTPANATYGTTISNTVTVTSDVTETDTSDNSATETTDIGCVAKPSGMTAWWRANNNAADIIGGQNGTMTNGATFAAGEVNQAFSFNGTNQYVSITNSADTAANFSMDAWIYPTSVANDAWVFSKEIPDPFNTAIGFYVQAGGKLIAGTRGSSGHTQYITDSVAIVPNQWQHVVVTYNGSAGTNTGQSFKFYVNGVFFSSAKAGQFSDQSGATLTGPGYNNGNAKIGSYYTGASGFFPGLIDEVEIFNRILTPTEAFNLYHGGTLGKCVLTDLSITKGDSPDPVAEANNLVYTLTAHNGGPDNASGVTVTDTLPANVSFVTASAGCTNSSGTVTCNIGPLANGADAVRTITVKPTHAAAGTTLTNTASVTGAEPDLNGSNNSANQMTTVAATPDVSVAVSPASRAEDSGLALAYTFTRTVTTGTLTVNFSVGGDATFGTNPGDDYTQSGAATFSSSSGTVSFTDGNSTAVVNVTPTADTDFESNETVILTVTSGTAYNVAANPNNTATGTITNDDAANSPPTVAADAGSKLFIARYGNQNRIARANVDGSGFDKNFFTVTGNPIGVAVDTATGELFWTQYGDGKIGRANLDGSNANSDFITGLTGPIGITVDSVNGRIYWAEDGSGTVKRANVDGSGVATIVTATNAYDVALDVANNKLYYCRYATDIIGRADLDGSNDFPNFITSGAPGSNIYGIGIDTVNGKIYWADFGASSIGRANLNGTSIENSFLNVTGGPDDVVVDPQAGKVYWTTQSSGVGRAKLDATGLTQPFLTGMGLVWGIALGDSDNEGSLATRTGTYSDPDGDTVTITTDVGSVVQTGTTSGTWTWTYTPPDGPANVPVTITATDSHGAASTAPFTLIVNNVAPTIALTGNSNVVQNTTYTLNLGAITDPGTDTVTGFSIDWGDGNTENFSGNPASTSKTHSYATTGSKTITVALTDEDGTHNSAGIKTITVDPPAETDVSVSGNDLVITDTNGGNTDDTLTISKNGSNVRVTDPNHTLSCGAGATTVDANTCDVPLASISGNIQVNTLAGNDTLTLDLSGGDFIPAGGVSYAGGDPTSGPGDKLIINGGSQGTVTYNYTNAHDGSVAMSNFGTVNFTGLEPITNSGDSTDTVFNLPSGPNAVTLADDGTSNTLSRLSAATIETTDFANPTNSLKINRGNAADTIAVNALPDFNASLTIGAAGSEFSTITFGGAVTLASNKNLAGDATSTINFSGSSSDIATSGTGTVTLTTARNINMASGSSISVVNGDLTLSANQQASPTTGAGFVGVDINGGTLTTTGTGKINVLGKGGTVGTSNRGIFLEPGSTINSTSAAAGAGTITLNGTGGPGTFNNRGVEINGPTCTLTSIVGDISITGKGGAGTASQNVGVNVDLGAAVTSTGAAKITIDGTGGAGTTTTTGARMAGDDSKVTSAGGDISITGHAGTGNNANNFGVVLLSGSLVSAAGTAKITIDGTGGSAGTSNNTGTLVTGQSSTSVATTVTSSGGDIQINGHGGGSSGSGNTNMGVSISTGALISATGGAKITLDGTGGSGTDRNWGTGISGAPSPGIPTKVTSDSGDISIIGHAGNGTTVGQIGINIDTGGAVVATGAANVTINGTGGVGTTDCYGVAFDSGNTTATGVSAVNGNINITGVSTDTTGAGQDGVRLEDSAGAQAAAITTTGTGTLTITGTAGNSTSFGIHLVDDCTMTLTGATNTFIADTIEFGTSNISVNANANALTLRQKTNNQAINLGAADSASQLGLTDTELDLISAGTLNFGDSNSGAITVSAAITRSTSTVLNLTSGGAINLNASSLDSGGGNVKLTPGSSAAVDPAATLSDVSMGTNTPGTLSFVSGADLSIAITGTTVDTQYRQLNVVGKVDLTGVDLVLSGSYTPVNGDTFTIVNNDGSDAITGTFNGLAEGATIPNFLGSSLSATITYTGGSGNDVVLTVFGTPEIDVKGNGTSIVDGDTTPDTADATDFGTTSVGNTVTHTFTVLNTGTAPLTLSGTPKVQVSGANAADFVVTAQPTSPVGASSSTTFIVQFTPSSSGSRTATISIANDDANENPYDFAIQGNGSDPACATPPAGMVAWWPGDGNADDVKGPTLENGTLVGGATFATGKVDRAFSLDGTDDYVEVPDSAAVDITGAISIDTWVKPNVLTNQIILSKYDTAQVPEKVSYILQLTSTGKILWHVYGGTDFRGVETADGAVAAGTFTHIAATFDPADQTMKIYVNGVDSAATLIGGSASIAAINNTDVPLRLGVAKSGSINNFVGFFNGLLDEVELFNTAISASDVAAIYNASYLGKCRTCVTPPTGMVSWWNGSGTGSTANDIAGSSPGTLQNGATFTTGKVGQAFSFNDNNDQVLVPHDAAQNTGAQITLDAWIRPTSFGALNANPSIINKRTSGNAEGYTLELNSAGTGLYFEITTSDGVFSTTASNALTLNTWQHVAATYNGATLKIFVNGVPVSSNSGTGAINAVTSDLVIGRNIFLGNSFPGQIDEVELFPRALSDSEIAAIADAGTAGKCAPAPEIDVQGNSQSIPDGSTSPSATDDTDFGSVSVGGNATHTFTIKNIGTAKLDITGITKTGTGAGDFSFGSLTPASPILSSGSATFTVTFAPSTTGQRSATIHIANSDGDEGDYDFAIQGNGLCTTPATPTATNGGPYCAGATIQLNTPTVAGATYAWTGPNGFTSALQNPTRSNATTADAGSYSVTVTVSGCTSAAGSTNVVVNATPATPTASNGGPYCEGATIQLNTPTVAGATYAWTGPNGFTSALQNPTRSNATTADAGSYSVTVTVSGCTSAAGSTNVVVNACNAEIAVEQPLGTDLTSGSPTPIDFGSSDSGVAAPSKTFTIKNKGSSDLNITGVTSDSPEFAVDTTGMMTTVAPNTDTTFKVTFTPAAPGPRNSTIHIANNDSDESSFDINVTGTGNCPTGFVVNSTGDGDDVNQGDGICDDGNGKCTLRAAISEANSLNENCGALTITFDIPADDPGHVYYKDDGVESSVTNDVAHIASTTLATEPGDIDPDYPHSWWRIKPGDSLPAITVPLTIDGYSQGANTQLAASQNTRHLNEGDDAILRIELDGEAIVQGTGDGLELEANDSCTIRGLVINHFATDIYIEDNGLDTIAGNFLGLDVSGTLTDGTFGNGVFVDSGEGSLIGGDVEADRNVISGHGGEGGAGIWIATSFTTVEGNYIGTDRNGVVALPNSFGVIVQQSDNTIGCEVLDGDNLISGNSQAGVQLSGANGTFVQGNFIGTDKTGQSAIPNGVGVTVFGGQSNYIGLVEFGNVISGNTGQGVELTGDTFNNYVQSNRIGIAADGTTPLGNGGNGVLIHASEMTERANGAANFQAPLGSTDNIIGVAPVFRRTQPAKQQTKTNKLATRSPGVSPTDNATGANVIAFNTLDGVRITGDGEVNNRISQNAIYSNGGLGINLGTDGVTPNDSGDGDLGPNELQNFPQILSVTTGASGTVHFSFDTCDEGPYTIEFFASQQCDGSGSGEGKTYLGSIEVPGSGTYDSDPMTINAGDVITATATDSFGNTSEFSACKGTATPTATNGTVSGQVVDTNGNPIEGAAVRMNGNQNRLTVTDAQGNYHFDNVETNGLYVVTPSRANFNFSPSQRSFSQLGAHTEATFTGAANGGALNPLDTTEYFVRQQYVDFLGREPDESGFSFWVNNIESCGSDAGCREVKRIDTSAAFFLSIEFQQTGYLVYRTYQAAYGDLLNAPVPIRLSEFKPDTQEISNGVVVLQDGWQKKLEDNKQAFLAGFVKRSRFTLAYPATMTPAEFVDKLFANAGVPLTESDHAAAIAEFGTATDSSDSAARARALRRVAENSTLTRQQFNQAFVLMEYFGYLRRDPNSGQDPDFSGYNFWLEKLNRFNGNFQNAEMVKAFLTSIEYRARFPR